MWHLASINKRGMAKSKWSVTLIQQRNDVSFTTDKLYSTVLQDKFSQEKSTREGVAVVSSKQIAYKRNYFHVGWSWLCVIQNGNASKMWVPRPILKVHSRVLTMLPVICTVPKQDEDAGNLQILLHLRSLFQLHDIAFAIIPFAMYVSSHTLLTVFK